MVGNEPSCGNSEVAKDKICGNLEQESEQACGNSEAESVEVTYGNSEQGREIKVYKMSINIDALHLIRL